MHNTMETLFQLHGVDVDPDDIQPCKEAMFDKILDACRSKGAELDAWLASLGALKTDLTKLGVESVGDQQALD